MVRTIRFCLGRFRASDSGVAAVEFSLFAPFLFVTALTAIDVGMAFTERMTMDHLLRAGANIAMADPGEKTVTDVVKAAAKKNWEECKSSTTDGTTAAQSGECISIPDVQKLYACPNAPEAGFEDVAGVSACGGDYYTYYRIELGKTYAGIILPEMKFAPSIQVQVR